MKITEHLTLTYRHIHKKNNFSARRKCFERTRSRHLKETKNKKKLEVETKGRKRLNNSTCTSAN